MNTLLELLDCVVTQNRFLQLRLNELLTRQGVGISGIPQLPNVRQQAVVDSALLRHQERIGGPPVIANQAANPPAANLPALPANPPAPSANPPTNAAIPPPAIPPEAAPTNPPNW